MKMRDGGSGKAGVIRCCHKSDRIGVISVDTCIYLKVRLDFRVSSGSGPLTGRYLSVRSSS